MNPAEISLVCGAFLSIVGVGTFFTVKVIPWLRKWSRVADRMLGVPADAASGQAAVPSIWERLDHQDEVLGVIKHEVEYNNSTSLKDAVRRTENATKEIAKKFDTYVANQTGQTNVTVVQTTPSN